MANLIKHIDEVTRQVPMNKLADYDKLEPFLANAERLYVLNLIGKLEFADLLAAYTSATFNTDLIIDSTIKQAILNAQRIISNIGYLFAAPLVSLSIGPNGIQIHSTADKKTAFQWQIEDLKRALQDLGGGGIEDLLLHLEENPLVFDKYAASENYQKQKKYLITTATEFSEYFDIKNSRFLFQSLGAIMYRIEAHVIEKSLGEGFLEALKQPNLSAPKKKLCNKYIKPALALLTAAKAIHERVFSFNEGVVTFNFVGTTQENLKASKELLEEKIMPLVNSLTGDANQYLADAKELILANLTDFPEFTEPLPERRFKAKNRKDAGIFMT